MIVNESSIEEKIMDVSEVFCCCHLLVNEPDVMSYQQSSDWFLRVAYCLIFVSCHLLPLLASTVQCLEMTTKRKLIGRLVPCRCFRGEEEVISVLDYSHCSLQQVPKEIFSFERTLEELYLDANQIEELPKVIMLFKLLNLDEAGQLSLALWITFCWPMLHLWNAHSRPCSRMKMHVFHALTCWWKAQQICIFARKTR